MNQSDVFNFEANALLVKYVQLGKLASWKISLLMPAIVFSAVGAIGAMLFEYEIMYRVFFYLAGDDSEYWSPRVMGFSAFIVVLGLHFLGLKHPEHPALKTLERIAGGLMLIFIIGIGLLMAALLYSGGGIGDMLGDVIMLPPLGETAKLGGTGTMAWVDALMQQVGNPLATLAFCLGIGSLTLMSVFVTHSAMHSVQTMLSDLVLRLNTRRADIQDYSTFLDKQAQYQALQKQWLELLRRDDETLSSEIYDEALTAIADGIAPTKAALADARLMQRDMPFADKPNLNVKEMEKRIAVLDAITHQTITKQLAQ